MKNLFGKVNFTITLRGYLNSIQTEHLENRQLLEKMTPDNRTYDELFTTHLFESHRLTEKDTKTVMDIIDNIRADILQAQSNQISAFEYFCMTAPQLARKVIENLPNQKREQQFKRQVFMPIFLIISFGILVLSPWLGGGLTTKNVGLFLILLLLNMLSWVIEIYFLNCFFKLYPTKPM